MTQTRRFPHRLLVPEFVLPSQFVGTLRRQVTRQSGEYRLLIAVLENAVQCFQKYAHAKRRDERRLFEEAERWLMGGNDAEDRRLDAQGLAFTFRYVCEALGIEPNYLRCGLKRWHTAQLAKGHVAVEHLRQDGHDRRRSDVGAQHAGP